MSAAMLSGAVVSTFPGRAFASAGTEVTVVPVVQSQTGLAFGTADVFDDLGLQSSGSYASTGQLGRGRYAFEVPFDSDLCAKNIVYGTATLTRSDGATVRGTATETKDCTTTAAAPWLPTAAQWTVVVGFDLTLTHGSRELVGAHLQFTGTFALEIDPGGSHGTASFSFRGTSSATTRVGYSMVDANGKAYAFGGIDHLGDALTAHAADIERTPSGNGYWIVNNAGRVYAFGDARYLGGGDTDRYLSGQRVTSMSSTPTGRGYWLFTADGRALRFGDATLFGDLASTPLNQPIIGSVATPTGKGYYMVASDGGVFAFGDAKFRGSMGGTHLNRPVVGLVPTTDNTGYWLVAADGGVFSFHAPFQGSMGAVALNRPIVTMVPYSSSYLMVASDGGLFNFSNGPFFGSEGGVHLAVPIVNGTAIG